ncbi:MAG: DNA polymerase III subunit gamma/tau [Tidjanibacter sp.]|nr:DNA polymerase III subunit gamma/tau [Tidjanibacter sp.]
MDNFIVSARKYRPATFRSVVGQSQVTETLKNAIQRGQLAHAYLFCGPRGVGKTTCARIFAKAINCSNPVDNEACGECESCKSFNEGRSFNIHELDAASNTGVDSIRDLIDQVRVPPQVGRYSVFIIDEVHMLSQAAFNAFLKTLEEPPAHAIFILATTEKHKILPTILSRCQIYDFNRIKVEDAVDYLRYIANQEGVESDDESLNLIAQKADGAMRDALSMFDKAVAFCSGKLEFKSVAHTLNVLDYDTYFRALSLIKSGDYQQLLLMLDEVLRSGFSASTFLSGLLDHLRDLLICKSPQTVSLLELSGSIAERYKMQSGEWSPDALFDLMSLLSEVEITLRSATNQRLHIELGLMKACSMGEKKNDFDEVGFSLPELLPDVAAGTQTAERVQVATPAPTKVAESPAPTAPAAAQPLPQSSTPAPKPQKPTSTAMLGVSIGAVLSGAHAEQAEAEEKGPTHIDPQSEEKMTAARDAFLEKLKNSRPRLAIALSAMTVSENKICATVPSLPLYEELMRNRGEIVGTMAEVSGVDGVIEVEIIINESKDNSRPITREDRYAFLVQRNPELKELIRSLDLEVE